MEKNRIKYILVGVIIVVLALVITSFANRTTYSTIYCRGSITATEYEGVNGEYVVADVKSDSYSNTTPYSKYFWEGDLNIQEYLTMAGIPYDYVETVYEFCVDNKCDGKYLISAGDKKVNLCISQKLESPEKDTKKYDVHMIFTNLENTRKIDVKLIGYCVRK